MDKFLMSSPVLSHMEYDQSTRSNITDLYEGSGLGLGFVPETRATSTSPPPDHSPFEHSRNLSLAPPPASTKQASRAAKQQARISASSLSSLDSVPQLSSSMSNQSLLDSPASLYYNNTVTPRKVGRKKSLSLSSANIYTTPSRANYSPAGANSANGMASGAPSGAINTNNSTGGGSKIGKTPHRGHSRSRSRLSLDAINTPFLLNGAPAFTTSTNNNNTSSSSNNNNNNTNSISTSHNFTANPFYTPSSFNSPRLDDLSGDLENLDTPIPTPSGSFVNLPSHNTFLSPAKNWVPSNVQFVYNKSGQQQQQQQQQKQHQAPHSAEGYVTPMALQRHDTLDSIKIEDQDDDALKQLRRTKHQSNRSRSFTNTSLPGSATTATAPNTTDMLSFAAGGGSSGNMVSSEELFLDVADLSLKLTSQDSKQEVVSAHSTPGGAMGMNNSPTHSFNSTLQNYQGGNNNATYSVPTSSVASFGDYSGHQSQYSFRNGSGNIGETGSGGMAIDLLSPQFATPYPGDGATPTSTDASFPKSYPTSVDLASISMQYNPQGAGGTSGSNSTHSYSKSTYMAQQAMSTTSSASTLLPPMATFSIAHEQHQHQQSQQITNHRQMVNLHPNPQSNSQSPDSYLHSELPNNQEMKNQPPPLIDPKKKHPCPLCDSRFQRPEHVKRHMKSHSKEKPFECDEPECGKRFNRKDNLKAHLKKIHKRVD
ncbi:hypothetical protein CAAN3_10S04874 [[Candida] anglica]